MKYLLIIVMLFPLLSEARDLVTVQEFEQLSPDQKSDILTAYKEFISQFTALESELESDETAFVKVFQIIPEAFASERLIADKGWSGRKEESRDSRRSE